MKFATALLGVLCVSALHANDKASTLTVNNTIPSNYTEAAATVAATGIGYWMVKNGKDFFKKDILPNQIGSWKGTEFSKTLAREATTAVLYTVAVVSLKTLLSNQFGGKVLGDGKIVAKFDADGKFMSNANWIEKAWSLGTACAFGMMAYEIGSGSILPDALKALKTRFSKSE